jgi:hypothetical protein
VAIEDVDAGQQHTHAMSNDVVKDGYKVEVTVGYVVKVGME